MIKEKSKNYQKKIKELSKKNQRKTEELEESSMHKLGKIKMLGGIDYDDVIALTRHNLYSLI